MIQVTDTLIRQARRVILARIENDDRYREFIVKLSLRTGLTLEQTVKQTEDIACLYLSDEPQPT